MASAKGKEDEAVQVTASGAPGLYTAENGELTETKSHVATTGVAGGGGGSVKHQLSTHTPSRC